MRCMILPEIATAPLPALTKAASKELSTHHRLLPQRHDYATLLGHVEEVAKLRRGTAARGSTQPVRGDVIFAHKGWRGSRPLTVMNLQDAIAYRYMCDRLAECIPVQLTERPAASEFKRALLSENDVEYISVTDVTAYYDFVDHNLLADELIAQTGEETIISQIIDLLQGILGRGIGLPQIHQSSDILGDTYIDPVRRRLIRHGFKTVSYSDDFRIGAKSLGDARRALEICAREMRSLGLTQNERKTFVWSNDRYASDLDSFALAERALFENAEELEAFWIDRYERDGNINAPTSLEEDPLIGGIEESDVVMGRDTTPVPHYEVTLHQLTAAERALGIWLEEDEGDEAQSRKDAAITQSLLGRALPILGAGNSSSPLQRSVSILQHEPALTPQLANYLIQYSRNGTPQMSEVRNTLDEIVSNDVLSDWQGVWIAHVAGYLRGSNPSRKHVKWLNNCVKVASDCVAAHAAAALGNIGRGDPDILTAGVNRIGPVWRSLALWGLARISTERARAIADDGIEIILVNRTPESDSRSSNAAREQYRNATRDRS